MLEQIPKKRGRIRVTYKPEKASDEEKLLIK